MSSIVLPSVLDLAAAHALKQQLLQAFAAPGPVTIDAGQVQRLTSPCLQVLAAAVARGAGIANVSSAFSVAAGALDLVQVLELEGPHVPFA